MTIQDNKIQDAKKDVTVVVGYAPIETEKGTPLLSQNRQFQYFNSPTYIYPMVPAYAASNLKDKGYTVYWMDGIAERKTYEQWLDELMATSPDFLLIETKSPVVKKQWKQIDDIKSKIKDIKVVIVGDHVTAFPEETFENCSVDYLIKGGDYDFVIVSLLNHIYNNEKLDGGVYWRDGDTNIKVEPAETIELKSGEKIYNSGIISLAHKLDELPFVDRDLTKWELYAYENGNYKYTPALL